ncbi:MMPL family transporter [Nocardia jejuensis]|uniref:MMPL family transporter n=1 Tax=Nocardia jejuensis TaxID=328049 RepID=UPI001FDF5E2D|nr:MMPL family transporter [Nocardia jejuensis]
MENSWLERIARFAVTRPRAVLGATLLLIIVCGGLGATVASHVKAGGFTPPEAESSRATELLNAEFGGAAPNFVLTVATDAGVESEQARTAGSELAALLHARPDIAVVQSYWSTAPDLRTALRSSDGHTALVLARIGGDDTAQQASADEIVDALPRFQDVTVKAGGYATTLRDLNAVSIQDLALAEAIAVPLSALVLVLVFGSLVAALLPVAIGLVSIVTTMALLRLLTEVTDVSVFALNTTTALGLALAIDYSLFIVSRYREEIEAGHDLPEAAVRAVCTAGRTVLYSALVVVLSLAALIVFPMFFLRSFAYSGLAVVAAAALAAVIVLPACLALLGPRINALDLRVPVRRILRRGAPRAVPPEQSAWYRMVTGVTRRAVPIAVVVLAILLLLGSPFLGIRFGTPDDRAIREGATSSREVGDILREDFTQNPANAITVGLPGFHGAPEAIGSYAAELSKVPGASAVLSGAGTYINGARLASAPAGMITDAGAVVAVSTALDPYSAAGEEQLDRLRAVTAPVPPLFTGAAAENVDSLHAIGAKLPIAAAWIVLAMFIVLFLFTGSVVLPVKALLMNFLSLTAAFGAMVWVFQDGHLAGLLGFTPTGYLVANVPIMMFCLAFGMSMDYEVFLLSRIREEWLASGGTTADNTHAVAMGVARTGRIFTAAAVLMAIVLGALTFSRLSFIQLMGLGLAITVLADATLVRCLLVPSLMRLMGRWNWWAPRPLRILHDRIGLSEREGSARTQVAAADAPPAESGAHRT